MKRKRRGKRKNIKGEIMVDYKKRIKDLEDILEVQGSKGNWDYSPYMHGLFNGMLLGLCTITTNKYEPRSAPKKWLYKNKGKKKPTVVEYETGKRNKLKPNDGHWWQNEKI